MRIFLKFSFLILLFQIAFSLSLLAYKPSSSRSDLESNVRTSLTRAEENFEAGRRDAAISQYRGIATALEQSPEINPDFVEQVNYRLACFLNWRGFDHLSGENGVVQNIETAFRFGLETFQVCPASKRGELGDICLSKTVSTALSSGVGEERVPQETALSFYKRAVDTDLGQEGLAYIRRPLTSYAQSLLSDADLTLRALPFLRTLRGIEPECAFHTTNLRNVLEAHGNAALKKNELENAAQIFTEAADLGSRVAVDRLAELSIRFFHGREVSRNIQRGISLLRASLDYDEREALQAALSDHSQAVVAERKKVLMTMLAVGGRTLFQESAEDPGKMNEALELLTEAAARGHEKAKETLPLFRAFATTSLQRQQSPSE